MGQRRHLVQYRIGVNTQPTLYTWRMKNISAITKGILERVEEKTGKSIQFMRDDNLSLLATLQLARHGADFHIFRYRPSNDPIDYFVAFQAGYALRLFENEPSKRFDFAAHPSSFESVAMLLSAGQALNAQDREVLPDFAQKVSQWALLNLRSLPIGMRIDRWISTEYPELKELQQAGVAVQQQQNMDVLAYKKGNLTLPTTLLGINAAYALFADRLLGSESYSIPYEAAGVLSHGRELLRIWDDTPSDAAHDCELVDKWAEATGMRDWYTWTPYIS